LFGKFRKRAFGKLTQAIDKEGTMVCPEIGEEEPRAVFGELIRDIEPQFHMMQGEVKTQTNRILVRFTNGFGLEILEFLAEEPALFVVMVLSFLSPGSDGHKLAQYIPIPEVQWLRCPEEVLALGHLVANLPAKWAAFKERENLIHKKVA
jgi:hypothetical protein